MHHPTLPTDPTLLATDDLLLQLQKEDAAALALLRLIAAAGLAVALLGLALRVLGA